MQTIAHRTRRPTWHSHPASPEQVDSIARNRGRKVLDSGLTDLLAAWDYAVEQGTPSKGEASTVLDALFAAPWLPRTPVVDHAGSTLKLQARQVYRAADGRVIRIQQSRETGSLYGKVLDQETGAWELPARRAGSPCRCPPADAGRGDCDLCRDRSVRQVLPDPDRRGVNRTRHRADLRPGVQLTQDQPGAIVAPGTAPHLTERRTT